MKQCPKCYKYNEDYSHFCSSCGYDFNSAPKPGVPVPPPVDDSSYNRNNAFDSCGPEGKSRGVAGLLAILLGGLGVQYFYLGRVGAGIITIILTIVTCGLWEIITLIQGILMLCMSNSEFRRKYVTTQSSFPLF